MIESNSAVHLLPPDPIDISVDHFDWNGDFNQATVESDYLRSMLLHLMKGLFWSLSFHSMMLFHAQWYVLALLQKVGGSLVFTQGKLLQLHQAQTAFQCGPNLVCAQSVLKAFPPVQQLSHQGFAVDFRFTVSTDYWRFLWDVPVRGQDKLILMFRLV